MKKLERTQLKNVIGGMKPPPGGNITCGQIKVKDECNDAPCTANCNGENTGGMCGWNTSLNTCQCGVGC